MSGSNRGQGLADPAVQAALILRVAVYWICCLAFVMIILLCDRIIADTDRPFFESFNMVDLAERYGPAAVAALFVLPLVVFDFIRTNRRYAGPLSQLRNSIRDLANGQRVEPVHFEGNDRELQELAEDFNSLVARVEKLNGTDAQPAVHPGAVDPLPA